MKTTTPLPKLYTSGPYAVSPEQIPVVEDARKCFYIGASSIPIKRDDPTSGWSYTPLDLFWCPVRHPVSNEHMFGLYRKDGQIMIRGVNGFNGVVTGVYVPANNILLYSIYRHDFFAPEGLPEGSPRVAVDGGRDYFRVVGNATDYQTVTIDLTERVYYGPDRKRKDFILPCSSHQADTADCDWRDRIQEAWQGYRSPVAG